MQEIREQITFKIDSNNRKCLDYTIKWVKTCMIKALRYWRTKLKMVSEDGKNLHTHGSVILHNTNELSYQNQSMDSMQNPRKVFKILHRFLKEQYSVSYGNRKYTD